MAADSSTSFQRRKISKPMIEKRRRARINSCLAQLKEIVINCSSNKNLAESRTGRMEKADILERTVDFMKNLCKTNNHSSDDLSESNSFMCEESESDRSFIEGYRYCMSEINKFISKHYEQEFSNSKEILNNSLENYLQQHFFALKNNEKKPSFVFLPSDIPENKTAKSDVATTMELFSLKNERRNSNEKQLKINLLLKDYTIDTHKNKIFEENSRIISSSESIFSPDKSSKIYVSISSIESGNAPRSFPSTLSNTEPHDDQKNAESMWRPW